MRTLALAFTLALVGTLPAQSAPSPGTIALTVASLGTAQSNAPVFAGIPFPPGIVVDATQIALSEGGLAKPRQVTVISSWPDGSVRVALLGFTITLAASETKTLTVAYNQGAGASTSIAWTRNMNVLALCPTSWYGSSGVFHMKFLPSAQNTLFPAFETAMVARYNSSSNPPSSTNPDQRNYYDHVHALYMVLLRNGGPASLVSRLWNEVNQYRTNEILHTGTYVGQYNAGSITTNGNPIPFGVVRRMYPEGLLEDYYFTGDVQSYNVAKECADAFKADATQQGAAFTWTERTPGWEILGLCSMYEATLDATYLDAALNIATIEMNHQSAMATKYPNQGGVSGQTGAFVQDKNDVWFDPSESTISGGGSPFMTTILCDGMIHLYWLTGNTAVRDSVIAACDWLADAAFEAPGASFWYVCKDTATGTTPSLNPMWLQMLGFAHQVTGESKYLAIAQAILAVNDWGNTIKEFNQGMRVCGQGLHLLQSAPGTLPLVWSASAGGGNTTPPPGAGGGGGGGGTTPPPPVNDGINHAGGDGCGCVGLDALVVLGLVLMLRRLWRL